MLFVISTYSGGGGSEMVLTVLANHLPRNWDVDILEVIAFNEKKEGVRKGIKILPNLVWHGYRTKFNTLLINVMFNHPEIIKTLRKLYNYDVVVGWMAVEGVSILKAFPESKTIAWFHNNIDYLKKTYQNDEVNMELYIDKWLFRILKNTCKNADELVCVSKMCKASIESVYPEYKNKISIIYNGTNVEELKNMSKEKIQDAELSAFYDKLVQKGPVLICVGHICKRKNFTLAVRSLAVLKKKNIACNLIIIGSASSNDELKDLQDEISRCNIQDNVFLFGYQKNPLPFVARSKLLLMTSLDEGFPTVVTEAMALGVPFVTTPVEGASDELSDGGRCGLVSDWDAEEYASCIEKLLKNEALYSAMSENCKEHVKKYSVENYVGSLQSLIDGIPEKDKSKHKEMNIVIATLLFIFYSAFYASYTNTNAYCVVRARLDYLKKHFSFLNLAKLLYRTCKWVLRLLRFPVMLLYCGVLVINYRKRLFAK